MEASIIRQEPGQAKIDILLVGDVTVQYLSDTVQKLFSNIAKVTITIRDVRKAAALLNECTFNMVFLKMTLPTAKELEAVKLIRFGRKKNIHLLFVFIIPENFKGHGADITLIEPLTMEKLSIVVKYWKTYFSNTVKNESSMKPEQSGFPLQKSCSEQLGCFSTDLFACSESLRKDIGLELKAPFSDFETSKKISLLHSSKEKLRRKLSLFLGEGTGVRVDENTFVAVVTGSGCSSWVMGLVPSPDQPGCLPQRERIKHCCEQLRTLVPSIKGRKNDAASILEATVDYVKYILKKIPPAAMGQITEVLQSNRRFCKKQQMPIQLSFPGTIMAQRENSVLASKHSPMRGISFLANKCLNVYSVPASGGSLDGTVRGQSSSTSENAIGDVYKTQVPSTAFSLNSFHAVKYYSTVIPSYDAVAVTNQDISVHFPSAVPKVSKFLPQQCNSVLGLQQFWAYQ